MNQATFQLSEFTNPSGEVVYRVSGWLDGKRVRKNLATRAEAEAERQVLEIQRAQSESLRSAVTRLTDDQLHEAEAIFRRLAGLDRSLTFYVDYALANYREPAKQKSLPEAVADYIAAKEREHRQGQLSISQLTHIRRGLTRLVKHFPGVTAAELSAGRLAAFFNLGKPGLKTYNNRRGVVSTFCKFAFHQEWITENPVLKVPHHRIRRPRCSAKTLTAEQAQELMAHVEAFQGGRLVPYFALCLFAGIRPCLRTGEILRLKPEHVRLDEGIIFITPEVSKIGEPRKVTIQPNLAAWLRAYPIKKFPIIVPNLQKYRARIAKRFGLSHDIMRHSYISNFVAKYRSIGEAALQAGNSESIIRRHYLDLKGSDEAEQFFGIIPKRIGMGGPTRIPSAEAAHPPLAIAV